MWWACALTYEHVAQDIVLDDQLGSYLVWFQQLYVATSEQRRFVQ